MPQIETIFFDCDGMLVDSEVICPRAYTTIFREFGIHVDLEEIFTRFRDVRLHEVIDTVSKEQGVTVVQVDTEHVHCAEVARLPDTELEDIAGANELLASINAPVYVVSDGPVSKMQYSLGRLNMLHYFSEELFSGHDIQRWKPDPALALYAAKAMNANVENCILVDDSNANTRSGIDAGMEVFCFCADPYNEPVVRPKATTSIHFSQLPKLWKARD